MAKSLTEKSLSGMVWVLTDKFGSTLVNFIVNIILARLLSEEDFGIIAMVVVFFEISTTLVYSGLPAALIREKEVTEADKSTTFFFNLGAALLLYLVLYASAPHIAVFFDQDQLQPIVRVMSLNLIIISFSIIQRTLLDRELHFKTQTKTRLAGILISGAVGVWMAFAGFGVWSLVTKFVLISLIDTVLLWIVSGWRPRMIFSMSSFKRLFGFGSKILATNFLDRTFTHIFKVVIGRVFTIGALGYYHWANSFRNLVVTSLFQTIQRVSYPLLSKLNTDPEALKKGYRQVLRISSFVMIPSMIWMAALAEPLVIASIGSKWIPAVPFLQLLCISGLAFHLNAINLNMLLVLGRSDLGLALEIYKKVGIVVAIVIGLQFGIYGLVIGEVVSAYVALLINTFYSKRLLRYSLLEQLGDVQATSIIAVVMGGVIYGVDQLIEGPAILRVTVGIVLGVGVYIGLHLASRSKEIDLLRNLVLPKVRSLLSKAPGMS
jgi:O-antigen/teichoic acid export membrane protein